MFQLYPIAVVILVMDLFYPVSFFAADYYFNTLQEIIGWYLYWLGLTKSYELDNLNFLHRIVLFASAPLVIRYWHLAQSVAVIWSLVTPIKNFDIIKKSL